MGRLTALLPRGQKTNSFSGRRSGSMLQAVAVASRLLTQGSRVRLCLAMSLEALVLPTGLSAPPKVARYRQARTALGSVVQEMATESVAVMATRKGAAMVILMVVPSAWGLEAATGVPLVTPLVASRLVLGYQEQQR